MKNKSVLLVGLMLFIGTLSYAQPGSLDGDFDADGKVTTDIGGSGDQAWSVAIQPDGKIIVAGYSSVDNESDFAIVRYHIDGSLDNSFSVDGIVTTDFGSGHDAGFSVVIQADGKILVAGTGGGSSADINFALARYNTDGSLDNSFSVDGIVTADFGGNSDNAKSIAVQADGKIVAAGYSNSNGFAVVRYNTDGTLDNSFGVAGKVTTAISGKQDLGQSVVIQPDGKIIVAGLSNNGTDQDFAVIRYNIDGSLDNNFSVDGIVTTDFGSGQDAGFSVVIQADGKIVVAGRSNSGGFTDFEFALVRYHTDGTLDHSFGVDGKVKTNIGIGVSEEGQSVVLQPDGKILLAGHAVREIDDFDTHDFGVVRYNIDGTLDNTFGIGGKVTTSFGSSAYGQGCAIQPNGRIVVVGYASGDFAVARYLSGLNVGVIDFSLEDLNLLIYPNPIQEDAVLEYTLANEEVLSLDLYDISGKLIKSIFKAETRASGGHKERLGLDTSIPSGSYILTITNGEGSSSIKIIK